MSSPEAGQTTTQRIGRYVIQRKLGQGSSGIVFLAHDPVIDRPVALKVGRPDLAGNQRRNQEQTFINEARAAGRLNHPNIIRIHDAPNEKGGTYIVMEYLPGREISKILAKGTRFDYKKTAAIIYKLAGALDYAHTNGVIHRDIKPENIFLENDEEPKLMDFGLARSPNRIGETQHYGEQPFTLFRNNVIGTPYYMSPEQALKTPVDERSDLYSLGAVMYEMLTGRKPFEADDAHKLLSMVAHKAPQAPEAVDRTVPAILSRIAMKAMQKVPEKRYQSGAEMANDLRRYLEMERQRSSHAVEPRNALAANSELNPSSGKRKLGPSAKLFAKAVQNKRVFWLSAILLLAAALAWVAAHR